MYKSRKRKSAKVVSKNNVEAKNKRAALNTIDENSTIKLTGIDNASTSANGKAGETNQDLGLQQQSSEENIPESQEPTQRYLSQRSNMAMTLTKTQSSRNMTYRPPNNYFELVLMKAGVQLDEADNFVLSCDHIAFVCKFREILVKSQNYPDNIESLKTGLRTALSAKSKLTQKLLTGCTISIPGEGNIYQSQDSMIVNFLMIDFLRAPVLEVLLDKIEETACGDTLKITVANVPLLPLLLAQLRYVTQGKHIYARIKQIFEKASETAKWDMIGNAEVIVDASKHNEFAQLLLDNMPESKDLFHKTTMQTLTGLSLNTKMQGKYRDKIISYIRDDQCAYMMLPILVKFLLKVLSEDNDSSIVELIKAIREILIWRTIPANPNSSDKQSQAELFKCIEQGLIRSKKFYTAWQKTIASLLPMQFRSIDFIILLLLIHIREDNSFYIENILRRGIKLEYITVDILNESKLKYVVVLEQHTNTLMQILHDFLKERNKAVADFARASYGVLFEIGDSIQKTILKKLLQLTCDKSTLNMSNLSLELLKDLQRKYPREIQNWGMILMPLLDRLNEMSLSQTRLVMELLCSIAYPKISMAECPALQDQIDMIIKKQIINRSAFVKKQGIIGSVQFIDSIARIEEKCIEIDEFDTTIETLSEIPEGRGKIAANWIERIKCSTINCPESLALFYDELAKVFAVAPNDHANTGYLDKSLLIWLCEMKTHFFRDYFTTEEPPETICGINLSYQMCKINPEDAGDSESEVFPIAINISELVLQPRNEASSSILVLAPLFHLLRVLHLQRYKGSLTQINALLGCSIVLPTFFDSATAYSIFYDYDEERQKKIMDIYFHTVNWMREVISSFSNQDENIIRKMVLKRLADVIEMETQIRQLLLRGPQEYMPPMCQFITQGATSPVAKKAATGRAKPPQTSSKAAQQKTNQSKNKTNQTPDIENATMNVTNLNDNTHMGDITMKLAAAGKSKNTGAGKLNFENLYGPKENYRPMGTDIILILHEELNIKYPLPAELVGVNIGLLEYRFILTDIVGKLESVTCLQKMPSEQNLQYIAKPHYFMHDLSKFLEIIAKNMQKLSTAIKTQLSNVKQVYSHAELFTEEFCYLKACFGLCFRLLAAYFSWSEFVDTTHAELLKDALIALLKPYDICDMASKTCAGLALEVFTIYIKYETSVVDLKTAVYLHQLLGTLKRHSAGSVDSAEVKKQANDIRKLCRSLLSRKWFNYDGAMEKGGQCNVYLDELVKGFLKNSDFKRQQQILAVVLEESKHLGGKDSILKSFPNFTKANFPLLFRDLCEAFISSMNYLMATNDTQTFQDKLEVWEQSCEILNTLLEIVQETNMPRNFQSFSKYSHMYLKMVLQHGMPLYEEYIRRKAERVSELLRSLQTTTRFLHSLCCHSKAIKNTAIVNQIPFLRETVENLVFRVKALLAANKCASVFTMGNLRNTDLHGEEILSQSDSLDTQNATKDSDEEIPDDDASVDETVHDSSSVQNAPSSRSSKDNRSKSSSRSKCF